MSQIRMMRLPVRLEASDVDTAVARLTRQNRSWTFEGPTTHTVDGRPAHAWSTTVPSRGGLVWARQQIVVLPYPDSTYVLSFWGQHPQWQDVDTLAAVLGSFHIPAPRRPLPKHPLIVTALVAVIAAIVRLRRPKPAPARMVKLRL